MDEYQESCLLLFRAVSRAIAAIDALNLGAARAILIKAQQEAEEAFLRQT